MVHIGGNLEDLVMDIWTAVPIPLTGGDLILTVTMPMVREAVGTMQIKVQSSKDTKPLSKFEERVKLRKAQAAYLKSHPGTICKTRKIKDYME